MSVGGQQEGGGPLGQQHLHPPEQGGGAWGHYQAEQGQDIPLEQPHGRGPATPHRHGHFNFGANFARVPTEIQTLGGALQGALNSVNT